ncbi:MAG: DUF6580 family putative transport protein [Chromatocurvus sp.]
MNRFIILLAWVMHWLPHPFGVSTIGATALYAGAYGNRGTAWLVPLAPLALVALFTSAYPTTVMLCVFAGFALATAIGRRCLSRRRSPARFTVAVIAAAVIFYLVSNLGVWLAGYYPATPAGLLACYIAGLPFLGLSLIADTVYSALLFGLHALAGNRGRRSALA